MASPGLLRRCSAWGIALAAALGARAQEPGERIGLVLSGGGARGCAHVGVLQVLEELRIPIHCVAGTSMGSIVGGLYAYGLSPEQLGHEVTRTGTRRSWAVLMQDASPRRERSFRRKQEDFDFFVDFGLGVREGELRLPLGLMQGQNLDLELSSLVPDAHALVSFDELPLPFRAVAVDLRTGHPVVLAAGNLAQAMRASMSLPGVFAPALIDGRELLDGGLADNVPIELARAMGATRVIVVDIGTPVEVERVSSALGVSTQMVQILTQQNVDRSLASLRDGDVYLKPDLGDITSADFERAAESVHIGALTARAATEQLQRYAVGAADYERYLARQRRRSAPVVVARVVVENRSGLADAAIRTRLRAVPGQVLDVDGLRHDIERIHGLGDFESVTFSLQPAAAGQHDLVVVATEKSWGPTYLRFGFALSSDLEGRSSFTLSSQASVRELNELGAEWRTAVYLGDRSAIDSEFYQPLESSGTVFVAPRLVASLYEQQAIGAEADISVQGGGIDLGVNLGTWSQIRVGVTRLRGEVDLRAIVPLAGLDFDDGSLEARWFVDTLDDGTFPNRGVRLVADWVAGREALGADQEYQTLTVGAVGYESLGATTFGLGAIHVTALDQDLPIYRRTSLGGFSRLSGLDDDSLGGQHSGFVAGILRHRVAGRSEEVLGFPVYLGGTIEVGNAWEQRDRVWRDLLLAGSLFVAVGTPIGPTFLAYGQAEGGERSFYLFVGQPF